MWCNTPMTYVYMPDHSKQELDNSEDAKAWLSVMHADL